MTASSATVRERLVFSKLPDLQPVVILIQIQGHLRHTVEDVLRKALSGLASMQDFLEKMHSAVGEDCPLCNQLRDKIAHSNMLHTPL